MSSSATVDDSNVNYGTRVIRVLSPMIAVVTAVIALRTLVVLRRHGHLSVDDWLALGAFVRLGITLKGSRFLSCLTKTYRIADFCLLA